MTKLPESGELGTNRIRNHFGGSGETSFPADYHRGEMVPDMQQLSGRGRFSNDTGAVSYTHLTLPTILLV